MNIYEFITRESTAFRFTRVAATHAGKAWRVFEARFPTVARHTERAPILVEKSVDKDLAEHYGCVNVDEAFPSR
jgi:hypothetical protein